MSPRQQSAKDICVLLPRCDGIVGNVVVFEPLDVCLLQVATNAHMHEARASVATELIELSHQETTLFFQHLLVARDSRNNERWYL